MKREIRTTRDGTKTLYVAHWDEFYHSVHGAHQESMHVFIKSGLDRCDADSIRILEFGLGTGLNAWLTAIHSTKRIQYTALEAFPLQEEEWTALDYPSLYPEHASLFREIHHAPWGVFHSIATHFTIKKLVSDIRTWTPGELQFDLIFYDAFAPSAQPELWTTEVFSHCLNALVPGGRLVTYCAKGDVKRNMKAAGFQVKALPGPPGKREMTQATKPLQ